MVIYSYLLRTFSFFSVLFGFQIASSPAMSYEEPQYSVVRDMDVRALGFSLGQTPFEEDVIIDLDGDGLSCGTGDNFVSAPPEMTSDLVDMEAYALAKICRQKAVEFQCFKFISDNANGDAADDWIQKLAFGARLFYDEILQKHSSFG